MQKLKQLLALFTFASISIGLWGQSFINKDSILKTLKKQFKLSEYDRVNNISKFNNDTILVSGYIGDEKLSPVKNLVFVTYDGGINWRKHLFKGDAWIYDAYITPQGNIWMGGSDEYVHFSPDFGNTWYLKPKPFKPINRVLSIYMKDSLNGIAGGLHNGLAITQDNWTTTRQIPTPLDQNKFTILSRSSRNDVKKLGLVDSIILINQNDHIYFSQTREINWIQFNIPVRDFSIDQDKKVINLFSLKNKVYILDFNLNLIDTYTIPIDSVFFKPPNNDQIKKDSFLIAGIKLIKVKGVWFDSEIVDGSGMSFVTMNQKSKEWKITDAESISTIDHILNSFEDYKKLLKKSLSFSKHDISDYSKYYKKIKTQREKDKEWGGDFSHQIDLENDLFLNPRKALEDMDQSIIDSAYNAYLPFIGQPSAFNPYIELNIINEKLDTFYITSKDWHMYSLPWTFEYKNRSFQSSDTRLNHFLKKTISKRFEQLSAAELIYSFIEQMVINRLVYQKPTF